MKRCVRRVTLWEHFLLLFRPERVWIVTGTSGGHWYIMQKCLGERIYQTHWGFPEDAR